MFKKIRNIDINTALFISATALMLTESSLFTTKQTECNLEVNLVVSSNTVTDNDNTFGISSYGSISEEDLIYKKEQELLKEQKEEVVEVKPDEEYSGMALSHEYEDFIIETAEEYNVPAEAILCLGNIESGGTWEVDPEKENGNYGKFQLNACNVKQIHEHFKRYPTIEETREALKYDDEFNAEAAIWITTLIIESTNCQNTNELAGYYNGGGDWRNIKRSVNYTHVFTTNMETYFPGKLDEVNEQIKNYKKPEEEKKFNRQLDEGILANNKFDRKTVKKLV